MDRRQAAVGDAGPRSGIETELEAWIANRSEDGLIVDGRYCWAREDAIRAAGMED